MEMGLGETDGRIMERGDLGKRDLSRLVEMCEWRSHIGFERSACDWERLKDNETDKAGKHADRQTQTDKHTHRDTQTYIQKNRHTDRHIGRHTDRHTLTYRQKECL